MGHTAHWMVLWMSVHGLVSGYEPTSLRECCEDGRARAEDRQDCTVHPLISSYKCSIVFEQCCLTVERGLLCDEGITMALTQGACERPFFEGLGHETQTAKMCCDCCSLGVATASDGLSWEDHELLLGRVCAYVARACCLRNTTEVTGHEVLLADPIVESYGCRDSGCEQLCVGHGVCACRDGYELHEDETHCEDINECVIGSHNCDYGLICMNTLGSFRCRRGNRCGPGYQLTAGNNCRDIDECRLGIHLCGPGFVCINTDGSFRCLPKDQCASGYARDAVGSCVDINECSYHPNPCQPDQICVNTIGSFTCLSQSVSCGPGHRPVEGGTRCEDIDECHTATNVCGVHRCVNVVGSFRCDCLAGFHFNGITKVCEDIDECAQPGERPCAHACENAVGFFQCSCRAGFQLAADGRSCHDIDECALPTGRKACPHQCINTPGSFNCSCPPGGFAPTHQGQKCQDIDECAAGTHTCSVSEQCFNIQGGYRCLSFTCPENFRHAARSFPTDTHVPADAFQMGPSNSVPGDQTLLKDADDSSFSVRCVKDCQPHDKICAMDPIHLITHAVLSMPTVRECSQPAEAVLLRTTAPSNPDATDGIDVFFSLVATDDHLSFDVVKRSKFGMIIGLIRQVKPIVGPKDVVLEVAMNYVKSGVVTHRNVVLVYVFVCEYWY